MEGHYAAYQTVILSPRSRRHAWHLTIHALRARETRHRPTTTPHHSRRTNRIPKARHRPATRPRGNRMSCLKALFRRGRHRRHTLKFTMTWR
nr:MAG TPA: hypothetical protein [Caudoviricetes sp.]